MLKARRLRVLVALGLVVVLLGGLLVAATRALRPAAAYALVDESTLVVLAGQVELAQGGGRFGQVTSDTLVRVGDRIRTGPDGYASLTYFDGSTTELEPHTELELRRLERVAGGGQQISFHQEAGKTWNRVERLIDAQSRFETTTASSVAFVRGTAYLVEITPEGETVVEVVDETVLVQALGDGPGAELAVAAGFRTRVRPGGAPSPPERVPPPRQAVRLTVSGPVRPFLTDDRRRSFGFHPEADRFTGQIPRARYEAGDPPSGAPQVLTIPDPTASYQVVLKGQGSGPYQVTVAVLVDGQEVAQLPRSRGLAAPRAALQVSGTIQPNQLLGFTFSLQGTTIQTSPPGTRSGAPEGSRAAFARTLPPPTAAATSTRVPSQTPSSVPSPTGVRITPPTTTTVASATPSSLPSETPTVIAAGATETNPVPAPSSPTIVVPTSPSPTVTVPAPTATPPASEPGLPTATSTPMSTEPASGPPTQVPTEVPSTTPTFAPSPSHTVTPSASVTSSVTPSFTPSPSATETLAPATATLTPNLEGNSNFGVSRFVPDTTQTPTHSRTASPTLTRQFTATVSPTTTVTATSSSTVTQTASPTTTPSQTPTATSTPSASATITPTTTSTHTPTPGP